MPYSSLSLNLLMLRNKNNSVIPVRINNSFHINNIPVPLIIMCLRLVMNQRAGIMVDNHCNTVGIFSIGKMNPLKSSVGNINPSIEMNIAIC